MAFGERVFAAFNSNVSLEDVEVINGESIDAIEVDVRGITILKGGRRIRTDFEDMVNLGVRRYGRRRLSVWARLARKPAVVGEKVICGNRLEIRLFLGTPLAFSLDLGAGENADRWEKVERLMQAAGMCLTSQPPSRG